MRHDGKLLDLHKSPSSEGPFLFSIPQPDTVSNDDVGALQPHSAIAAELLSIRDYERRRIGQELHDSAGQLLVALQLSVARLRLVGQTCDRESLIEEIQDTVRQIDHEIRTLAFLHHPAELHDRSLIVALQMLVQGFSKRTGVRATFEFAGEAITIAEPISFAMLRIAQEALVNVHRHSRASVAKVVLQSDGTTLRLTVSDNGIGIRPDIQTRGVGIEGMRSRAEMLGGSFDVHNLKHGTKLSVSMPLA